MFILHTLQLYRENHMLAAFRRAIPLVIIDGFIVAASLALAWSVRAITAPLDPERAIRFGLLAVILCCIVNYIFGLYGRLWRYSAASEVVSIAGAAAVGTAIITFANLLWPGPRPLPLSVVLVSGFISCGGFTMARYQRRVFSGLRWRWRAISGEFPSQRARLLIYGAGEAGQMLARRLLNQKEGADYQLAGFIDDDPAKVGLRLHGMPVLGTRQALVDVVERERVDMIVIAINKISGDGMLAILAACEKTPARIRVLPNITEYLGHTDNLPRVREVNSEDLLGRRAVKIDYQVCRAILEDKVVLVTGAAGSIGSELCRQVAAYAPRTLLLLDNNETGLHDLSIDMAARPGAPPMIRLVADVTVRPKLEAIFAQHRPRVVFHAAAYKHVPLMEEHPDEAVRVNVMGTRQVAELACQYGAERFVLISTDKAVHPTSIMGATKRLGEAFVTAMAGKSGTLCTGVRFGNVLGSRGSVVPTFERQIDAGGPVTVTDPRMTRYFMSISEAVSLVIQAATATQGGDLFLLDMGQPIRIQELAERLIRLRGLRPGVDIPIAYIGLRPGEKLHEELTGNGDRTEPTAHPSISCVFSSHCVDSQALLRHIDELVHLAESQRNGQLTARLWEIVGEDVGEATGTSKSA